MGRAEFSGTVIVQNASTLMSPGSLFGQLGVGTAPVEVKVGASKLTNRSVVTIQANPNNSDKIYVGLDNTVSASKYAYVLTAGAMVSIEVEPSKALTIFAMSPTASQNVGVIEGAN